MFEFLKSNPAAAILKEDHKRVKDLFKQFENTTNRVAKLKIARRALAELEVHAELEEKLFYPAVRSKVGSEVMNEADEEHHVAKLLIAELGEMNGSESHFDAKFIVLAENVRHHIKEEENEMLPEAQKAKVDFEALAKKMRAAKTRLTFNGVPDSSEEKMIKRTRGKVDSPARAAKRKRPKLAKTRAKSKR